MDTFYYLWVCPEQAIGKHGRASPRHFQTDNKHILQKTEFGEAKFSRSGEKKKGGGEDSANKLSFYEPEGLLTLRKECPCWAGSGDCNLHKKFKRLLETHQ